MPTLNIDGRKVTVGDEFLKLSPDKQNATVDEIHKSFGVSPSAAGGSTMPVPKPPGGTDTSKPSGFLDFFKSIPRGLVQGATDAMSAMGQAEATTGAGAVGGGAKDVALAKQVPDADASTKLVEGNVTGKLHEPETFGGRLGAGVGRAAGNPVSYVGPGGMLGKGAAGAGSAVGSEVGGELTGGSAAGRIIGGGLGGLAGGAKGAIRQDIPAPSRAVIRDAAEKAYDTIKDSPRKIPMEDMAGRTAQEIPSFGASPGPPALQVARLMPDGSLKVGKPGDIHADLMSRAELNTPKDSPQVAQAMGYAHNGKFMTREEALQFAQQNEPHRAAWSVEQPEFGLDAATYNDPRPSALPVRTALRDASEAAYDTIKNSPRKIATEETSGLAEQLRTKLNSEGIYREGESFAVFKQIDRLTNALNADHITPGEIHAVTKTLQAIANRNVGKEAAFAATATRKAIFSYLQKFPELAEAIEIGNANWRALKTSEKIDLAKQKGEFGAKTTVTGDNIDPALRSQMRQLYFNNKVAKSPEEKELLRSIVEGDTSSNIAKRFRALKTPLKYMAEGIMHAKSAGILAQGAHMLAKSIANRNTSRQVEKLDELVRRNSPAAGPARPGVPRGEEVGKGTQRGIQAGRGAAEKTQSGRLYED